MFAAGTLVLTDTGLVAIEHLKVGDMVLSKQEPDGERSYKPVTNIFAFEAKELRYIQFVPKEEFDAATQERRYMRPETYACLAATDDHLLWAMGKGWTRADHLEPEDELELADGSILLVMDSEPIHCTKTEGVGWIKGAFHSEFGTEIDFRNGRAVMDFLAPVDSLNEGISWWEEGNLFKSTVYNIDVDGYHTYYAGENRIFVSAELPPEIAGTAGTAHRFQERLRALSQSPLLQISGVIYFRRNGETMLGECTVFLEAIDNYATRQVDDYGDMKLWADIRSTSDDRIMLADQPINLMGFEPAHEISADEFEAVWNLAQKRTT